MRLLVIEDEKKIANFIRRGLEEEAYAVDVAHDGEHGAYLAENVDYDLVILDLMLPKLSGLELLDLLRQKRRNIPILVLTARAGLEDRIRGLDRGADDYLAKPFAFAELSARVRAILRRGHEVGELQVGELRISADRRMAFCAGRKIELSNKEFALLEFLMRNAGRPVTRTMIIEHVWDIHFENGTNVVDVYINYLRRKLDNGCQPSLIQTVRGVGYVLSGKPS